MLNVHHLELFYYVARHKGITEAARHIPYGIQQPAISGQMGQLEDSLGLVLFHRRPFRLTPAGAKLYEFILPFFSHLEHMEAALRGEEDVHLRLAASGMVLAKHLPDLFQQLRAEYPALRLTLRDVSASEALGLVQREEVDLALTILQKAEVPGVQRMELMRLQMGLLVPESCKAKTLEKLLTRDASGRFVGKEPLISVPDHELIGQIFQDALAERGILWRSHVEVNNLEIIESYVLAGFGVGLSLDVPAQPPRAGLRRIPLPGLPPLVIGFATVGKPKPVVARFMQKVVEQARKLEKIERR